MPKVTADSFYSGEEPRMGRIRVEAFFCSRTIQWRTEGSMPKEDIAANRSRDADSLRAAFGREGCPVCIVVLESMQLAMDGWQYEGFTDVEQRHELIRSRGFCPLHTWQLAQHNTAFQLALVYSGVLPDVLARLKQDAARHSIPERPSRWSRWWKRWTRRPATTYAEPAFERCPFCRSRASVEQRLISTLLELLLSEEIRGLLSQSTGLCLLHFTQAHARAEERDPLQLHSLLECQQVCTQRILGEVEELIRKHDYRFGDETHGDEMTAWRRAAQLCAGNPGVR
jgi:hypothetical protein